MFSRQLTGGKIRFPAETERLHVSLLYLVTRGWGEEVHVCLFLELKQRHLMGIW